MATDFTVTLEDRPGELARLGEALGGAGINIDGFAATTAAGRGEVHVLVEDEASARTALEGAGIAVTGSRPVLVLDVPDRPGALGETARKLAGAGVNVEVAYAAANSRLVLGVDDLDNARSALG